jgi:hypothetical protein
MISTGRRPDGAGRRGQHRQEPIERVGGNQRGLVAADGRLRRQRIHRLRARDARHQFHREAGDLALAQRAHHVQLRVRLHETDDQRARLELPDLRHAQRLHRQQHVGLPPAPPPGCRPIRPFCRAHRETAR